MKRIQFVFFAMLVLAACNNEQKENKTEVKAGIAKKEFGKIGDSTISLYTITNKNGDKISITNYGGIVTEWVSKDKHDSSKNVLVGFDTLTSYLQSPPYFGALIGRYGNRIGNAKFKMGTQEYTLAANDGKNHLHGGVKGFDKVIWKATPLENEQALLLEYFSKDGEEGYPGNLKVAVKYSFSDNNELSIEYNAETDKATPVNLTQHNYYNLSGDFSKTVLNEALQIFADNYTPVDATLIPTGKIEKVAATPFDFLQPHTIGERIDSVKGGYDHNWVLSKTEPMHLAAILIDTTSGKKLTVETMEPGLQFYSGNFLDGKFKSPTGVAYNVHTALCLETQHYPDSPNKPNFPSTILEPGKKYHTITKYTLQVVK
jgi:aldose 1-epimerase